MNFRSTLYLAFVLALMAVGYLWLQTRAGAADKATTATKARFGASPNERDLIDTKDQPTDLVKITVRRKGEDEWVFEREAPVPGETSDDPNKKWHMTAPIKTNVAAYDVDRIGRQIRALRYEVSYATSDSSGPSLASVGLEPPETVVTLTDKDGKSVTLEIGRPASERSLYVHLAGRDECCIVTNSLDGLFKETALAYRDMQLWKFAPENVTGVEIVDRTSPGHELRYAFAKTGGHWMFETPITARATTKLDDMVRSLSNLRAVGWNDSRPERLASYGLQPAAWTIKCTVTEPPKEEEKEAESNDSNEEEAKGQTSPAPEIREYTLQLSDRSPIGEETKQFMRIGDEPIVGTIMKYAADKFKPDMALWRDMSITTANVTDATRIEVSTGEGAFALAKNGGTWTFETDGAKAEDATVTKFLSSIQKLKAVAFVDDAAGQLDQFGLKQPRVQLRLTIPGAQEVERLSVGNFSDPDTQKLVYVRRNEMSSFAKIWASEADQLTPGRYTFEDHTILDVSPAKVDRIAVWRNDHCTGTPTSLEFERSGDQWKMTAPVSSAVQGSAFRGFLNAVAQLRAQAIVPSSDQSVLGSMKTPLARITVDYREPAPAASGVDASGEGPQPASENDEKRTSTTINLALLGDHYYAQRAGAANAFEVSKEFFDKAFQEFRDTKILNFDESKIAEFTVRNGANSFTFQRDGKDWRYQPEPDLPLDAKKVDNLLLQFKDLKTERYVGYGETDLESLGLAKPAHDVTVKLFDGTTHSLHVSSQACTKFPEEGIYANVAGQSDVFLLKPDTVTRITVALDELERKP